jgi:isopentenyl-diphosphate delta-isomerase
MKQDISSRKLQHIQIVLEENVTPLPSSLSKYRLPYKALPEIDLAEIDTSHEFFGKRLSFPFVVASMTGGAEKAGIINKNLALACEQEKVALALGSMRVILKDPSAAESFKVRSLCPSIPLFANMGLVQLNYGYGSDEINRLLDIVEADGIFLHVNHLQESIQPEGDTNFKGLLGKLAEILPKINKPVIIKEVGSGIDKQTAQALYDIGIKWIDVSGMGGTSWTSVEAYRRQDDMGFIFEEVGIPLDEALIDAKQIAGLQLIACGGIRNGLDMLKAFALGADIASAAAPLLKPALESSESVSKIFSRWRRELEIAMFTAGVASISECAALKLKKQE